MNVDFPSKNKVYIERALNFFQFLIGGNSEIEVKLKFIYSIFESYVISSGNYLRFGFEEMFKNFNFFNSLIAGEIFSMRFSETLRCFKNLSFPISSGIYLILLNPILKKVILSKIAVELENIFKTFEIFEILLYIKLNFVILGKLLYYWKISSISSSWMFFYIRKIDYFYFLNEFLKVFGTKYFLFKVYSFIWETYCPKSLFVMIKYFLRKAFTPLFLLTSAIY